MAAISVFQRVEKKYRMDQTAFGKILPLINEHMEEDSYCKGGKSYRICNLYYDTEHYDVIRESLKKPFFKEKLRLRTYGWPASEESIAFLELKRKINGLVTKRRATLSYGVALRFMAPYLQGEGFSSKELSLPEDLSYINRQVLKEIQEYLAYSPVATGTLLTYERVARFGREDPGFRLTFDRNIRFKRCVKDMTSLSEDTMIPLMHEDFILMEAKAEGAFPLWFSRLLSREEIRPQSFSKYGVAYKTYLKKDCLNDDDRIDVLGRI